MDREEAIRTMAERLAVESGLSAAAVLGSALAREAEESTYLGRGLAVPHARLAGLPAPLVCLARCEEGIDWQGERAVLTALLVVPAERPELHLALLGTLARACAAAKGAQHADVELLAKQLAAVTA